MLRMRRRLGAPFAALRQRANVDDVDDDNDGDDARSRARDVFGRVARTRATTMVTAAALVALCLCVLVLLVRIALSRRGARDARAALSAVRRGDVTFVAGAYVDLDVLLRVLRRFAAAQRMAEADTSALSLAPRPRAGRPCTAAASVSASILVGDACGDAMAATTSLTRDYVRRFVSSSPLRDAQTRIGATPEAVLYDYFYSTTHGMPYMNAEAERDVYDDGYAATSLPSRTFYDAAQTVRRGYGLEGSIFVVLPFVPDAASLAAPQRRDDDANATAPAAAAASAVQHTRVHATGWPVYTHAACARTLHSIFADARWPAAVTVATAEYALVTRARDAGGAAGWRRWVLSCVPARHETATQHERRGVRDGDQLRVRHIRLPPLRTASLSGGDGSGSRGTAHARVLPGTSLHALRAALLRLYAGESYVLLVRPDSVLVPAWDWRARLLYTQSPARTRAVLSTRPRRAHDMLWAVMVERAMDEPLLLLLPPQQSQQQLQRGEEASAATAMAKAHDGNAAAVAGDARYKRCLAALVTPYWLHGALSRAMRQRQQQQEQAEHNASHMTRHSTTHDSADKAAAEAGADDDNDALTLLHRACAPLREYVHGTSMTDDDVVDTVLLAPLPAPLSSSTHDAAANTHTGNGDNDDDNDDAAEVTASCRRPLQQQQQLRSWLTDTSPSRPSTTPLQLDKRAYEHCWLLQRRVQLRQAVMARLERHDAVAVLTPHCAAANNNSNNAGGEDGGACASPLHYRIAPHTTRRTSDSLRDARYLHARGVATAHGHGAAASPPAAAAPPPLATQAVASTAFLFARAEAFVAMPAALQLRFAPPAPVAGNDTLRDDDDDDDVAPAPVTLDAAAPLAQADEVDMVLSAQLWTRGWTVYAPGEPLCYDVALHDADAEQAQQQGRHGQQQQQGGRQTAHARDAAQTTTTSTTPVASDGAVYAAQLRDDTLGRLRAAVAREARRSAQTRRPSTCRATTAAHTCAQRTLAEYVTYLRACDTTAAL